MISPNLAALILGLKARDVYGEVIGEGIDMVWPQHYMNGLSAARCDEEGK